MRLAANMGTWVSVHAVQAGVYPFRATGNGGTLHQHPIAPVTARPCRPIPIQQRAFRTARVSLTAAQPRPPRAAGANTEENTMPRLTPKKLAVKAKKAAKRVAAKGKAAPKARGR